MSKKKKKRISSQPPVVRKNSSPQITRTTTELSYQGPFPPPGLIKAFEDAHPGMAERIINHAEKEQEHRHTMEKSALATEKKKDYLGMFFGWTIACAGIGVGGYLVYSGEPWGSTFTLTALAVLVGKFIPRR